MKIYKLFTLIAAFFVLFSLNTTGQNKATLLREANLAYKCKQFSTAIDLYKKAYKKVDRNTKADIIYNVAECYRLLKDSRNSEVWYKKAIKIKYPEQSIYLYYAESLRSQGKYDLAMIEYEEYKKVRQDDPRGENGIKSCQLALKWKDSPNRYIVENMSQINTKFDEWSSAYADKTYSELLFSSNREGSIGSTPSGVTGKAFHDIYYTKIDNKGKWSTPIPITETVNTYAAEGTPYFDSEYSTLYFTRCGVEKKKKLGCVIMMAPKNNLEFGDAEELPIPGVSDTSVMGHATISKDGLSLYFAANLAGGYGGNDIWVIYRKRTQDQWVRTPINLGPAINTPGEEVFPFIHPDGSLYFSSDGHIGMGGLDIFKAETTQDDARKFGNPINLKCPINSEGDDFGIIIEEEMERGYFTSDRIGGKNGTDIYYFYLPPLKFTLSGVVKDIETKNIIAGASVSLEGTDGTNLQVNTDVAGAYNFDETVIMPNTTYILNVSKEQETKYSPRYLNSVAKTTTINLNISTDLKLNFELTPVVEEKEIVLPEIRYDLDKWDLKPQYQDSLLGLIKTLNDNPTITIVLRSHTDCRGSDEYNQKLSEKRAQSVVNFLIEKGIDPDRLQFKGMGEGEPRKINEKLKGLTPFEEGLLLNCDYVTAIKNDVDRELAHQLNRRTDFKIVSWNFAPKKKVDTKQKTN